MDPLKKSILRGIVRLTPIVFSATAIFVMSPRALPCQAQTGQLGGLVQWNNVGSYDVPVLLCEVERRIKSGKKQFSTGRPLYDGCKNKRTATSAEDGSYIFEGVPPGAYIVMARSGDSWVFPSTLGGALVAIANTHIGTEIFTVSAGKRTEVQTLALVVEVELIEPVRGKQLDGSPITLSWRPLDETTEYKVSLFHGQFTRDHQTGRKLLTSGPLLGMRVFQDQPTFESRYAVTQHLEDGEYFWWVEAWGWESTKIGESWNYYRTTQALTDHIGYFVVASTGP